MSRCIALLSASAISLIYSCLSSASTPPSATASAPYAWRSVEIIGGGFISGIVPHPSAKDLVYVRTDVGGAYRLDPVSRRWIPITDWIHQDQWTLTGIESIGLDPADPNRVYLAAGSYTNDWSGNGSILRSTDRGATWQVTPMPFKFGGNDLGRSNGERLAVDPSSPNILYVGSRKDGLWRSADHGATWARVDSFPTPGDTKDIGIVAVVFPPLAKTTPARPTAGKATDAKPFARKHSPSAPSRVIYAVVSSPTAPLWRSDDAGATWTPVVGQPLGLRPHQAKFGPDGWLYLTYGDDAGPNGLSDGAVWKHQPAAKTWIDITPLKPAADDRFGYAGLGLDAQKPGALVVSTLCRWARHDELFRSTDGGATWKRITPAASFDENGVHFLRWGKAKADLGHWIGDLEIDPFNSDRALYGTGMTIWGTDNLTAVDRDQPTSWLVRAQGIEETVINELVSPSDGAPLLSAMWDIDGFRHERLDASPEAGFFQPSRGRNTSIDVAGLAPDIAARAYWKGGAYSTDNGRTWTAFPTLPVESAGDGHLAVSANGDTILWLPENQAAWLTRDQGKTWQKAKGLPERLSPVADRVDPSAFYAYDPRDGGVYASADGGLTFAKTAQVGPGGGRLASVFGLAGHVWVVDRTGLHRSANHGHGFERATEEVAGHQIAFGHAAPGSRIPAIYVAGRRGGERGVFRSLDGARSWTRLNPENLQFHSISALAADPRVFGRVYVGTRGRGIFYGEPAK